MREFPLVDDRAVAVVPDRGLRRRGGWREPGAAGVQGGEGVERVDSPFADGARGSSRDDRAFHAALEEIFHRADFVGAERGGTLQYEAEFLFTGLSGSGPPFVWSVACVLTVTPTQSFDEV